MLRSRSRTPQQEPAVARRFLQYVAQKTLVNMLAEVLPQALTSASSAFMGTCVSLTRERGVNFLLSHNELKFSLSAEQGGDFRKYTISERFTVRE